MQNNSIWVGLNAGPRPAVESVTLLITSSNGDTEVQVFGFAPESWKLYSGYICERRSAYRQRNIIKKKKDKSFFSWRAAVLYITAFTVWVTVPQSADLFLP